MCYNKGHILHQFTFFIGDVNFYWKDSLGFQCKQMKTGDSNYIPPFVPHSFTSRNIKKPGLIIAVTFADILSYSRIKFSLYKRGVIESFSGNHNVKYSYLKLFIKNYLNENFIGDNEFFEKMKEYGISKKNAVNILNGKRKPKKDEFISLSALLRISSNHLKTIVENKPLKVINKKFNKKKFREIQSNMKNLKYGI